MCGIVGLAGAWSPELMSRLHTVLEHRGPDDLGEMHDPQAGVSFATRRLSILDLDGGRQPMSNEDESVWIVFNGEIFNSPDLRHSLQKHGHEFKSHNSDTECLIHLYEEKAEGMLKDLNGMFSFVILDKRKQLLFGARDRFGIKPLYYSHATAKFAFASELKALLLLPSVSRDLNEQSLYHYLSLRYVPGPDSIFEDVKRIPPAHYFVYDLSSQTLTTRRYWRPSARVTEYRSKAECSEFVRVELRAAVSRWVLSDVPVACSLSGGLDSASITGLLAEMGHRPLRTYTLGFGRADESRWSELALARQIAQKWGTDHHELILQPDDLLEDLVQMVWFLDEPYGGGLPSWYVFRFMGEDVKVGLTGTGGDEIFGSYGKWRRFEAGLQGWRSSSLKSALRRAGRRSATVLPEWIVGQERKSGHIEDLEKFDRPMDAYELYFGDRVKRSELLALESKDLTATEDWLQGVYEASDGVNARTGFTFVDMQTQLPEEFLLMTDRFSMAHSLEARVPFLDHIFVERMLEIPAEVRTDPSDLKYLLRNAMARYLPRDVRNSPKHGFVLPDTIWLRDKLRPLAEHLLGRDRLARQGLMRPDAYDLYVRPHLEGQADFTGQVWTLLMFQLWHLVFVEEATETSPTYSLDDLT
ncbi:MAG: asparagine synthase (glutamine-hydrolyzing) [Anaerolineales bacterium]